MRDAWGACSNMRANADLLERVPLSDPRGEAQQLRAEISASLMRVVDSGFYILGPEVAAFEKSLAASIGTVEAIGVASGTDALTLAMLGLEVGSGDEVITVSHTAGPTVAAIRMVGATPVLVDIEVESYCIDPAKIERAITPRTRAIIAVHLYGHPANMSALKQASANHGIPLIEDCAQAQGATIDARQVGSFGEVACFSFYPTKNLGALGDGGAVVTGDPVSLIGCGNFERTAGPNRNLLRLTVAAVRAWMKSRQQFLPSSSKGWTATSNTAARLPIGIAPVWHSCR